MRITSADRKTPVKLISSHRLIRGQDYGALLLVSTSRILGARRAGRGDAFEVEAVVEQLAFFVRLLGDVRIVLTPLASTLLR